MSTPISYANQHVVEDFFVSMLPEVTVSRLRAVVIPKAVKGPLAAVAALILAAPRPLAAIFASDASVLDAFVRARLGPCLAAEARSPEITERTRDRPRLGSASPQSR